MTSLPYKDNHINIKAILNNRAVDMSRNDHALLKRQITVAIPKLETFSS